MPNASTHLEHVSLELTGTQDSFNDAIQGVDWVFHTASPVSLEKVQDEQRTIIKPAVNGTLKMLQAANTSRSTTNVVFTSSIAAIAAGRRGAKNCFTEDDSTNADGPRVNAYSRSKTLAEQAAWKFMNDGARTFSLAVINPAIVMGPIRIIELGRAFHTYSQR